VCPSSGLAVVVALAPTVVAVAVAPTVVAVAVAPTVVAVVVVAPVMTEQVSARPRYLIQTGGLRDITCHHLISLMMEIRMSSGT
jgi:hypothetical protein